MPCNQNFKQLLSTCFASPARLPSHHRCLHSGLPATPKQGLAAGGLLLEQGPGVQDRDAAAHDLGLLQEQGPGLQEQDAARQAGAKLQELEQQEGAVVLQPLMNSC